MTNDESGKVEDAGFGCLKEGMKRLVSQRLPIRS